MGTKHLTPINNRDLHASIGLGIYDKEMRWKAYHSIRQNENTPKKIFFAA